MTNAITVENIGKRYQLGVREAQHDTLREALIAIAKSPLSRFKRLAGDVDGDEFFWALRNIDFTLKEGEVLGVIGHNGAGKSTLLKILSRITEPTEGRAVTTGRVASLLEVGTGFHQELSGRENVYLNGAILGMARREIDRKFDEIVDFSGTERFLDTPIKRYSSGMKVRLAFAVAAHLEPEILIIDEVLAVGDQEFQNKCLGKMNDVASSGRTVLFVSHNMGAVRNLCTRSILLKAGGVVADGETPAIIEQYLRAGTTTFENGLFTRSPEEIDAQPFRIHQVTLSAQPDGNNTSEFDCDDEVHIKVRFDALRPVPGMFGYLSIQRSDGILVLESDSCDQGINPLDLLDAESGEFSVVIPPRLLGPGQYLIHMSFHSASDSSGFDIDRAGVVGEFRMSDTCTQRGNRRRGFMSARLPWTVASPAQQ